MLAANRVAKNTGILYVRMAITVFISLYATRLVLAALGVADFGLFNVVGGAIAMLGFLNSSMAAATQRFMSFAQGEGDLEKVKRIFNMSIVLHAGIAILMVLVFEIVGYFFFNGILNISPDRLEVAKIIYHFMVASTFFTVLSVPYEAVITSHENMLFYAILGIIEAILKLGIALYITYSALDHLIAYGFLMAALSIFLLILRRIYCHRTYTECVLDFRKYYEKDLMIEISSFAGWSLMGSVSSMLSFYGLGIIINIFFGTAVNAAQGISNQIAGQLSVFAKTMMNALNPMIGKSAGAGDIDLMLKATIMGSKISFYMIAILYIPFLVEMPFILKIWLNEVPEYTVAFCRLVLIRNLIEQFQIPLTSSINAIGNIGKFQKFNSVISFLPIIVAYLLFRNGFSPISIYIYYIFNTIFMLLGVIYFAKIYCNLPAVYFFKKVIFTGVLIFTLSLTLSLLTFFLFENEVFRLIGVFVLSIFSFIIFVWFLGLSSNERTLILNLKNKRNLKMNL